MTSASSRRPVAPGDVLAGRYLLERVVGEGGMGLVFAAQDRQTNELVAVKVLSPDADEETIERFHREARLAIRLASEHVVRVYDVHEAEETVPAFLVMELLDGSDLSGLLDARGALPVVEATGYVLQACKALVEAHAMGIVHRDLKPSNLYVTRTMSGAPLVKILDFGISKTQDEDDVKLTTTRSVFGSPAYMSPEQIRSAKHVDARADLWSLGVVLYELLSKQLPFAGDNAASMLAAIAADPPLSLRARSPYPVPLDLERIVEACLVKDRAQRLGSAAELAQLLTPFAEGRPITAGLTARLAPSMPPPLPSRPADPLPEAAMARTDRAITQRRGHGGLIAGVVLGALLVLAGAVTLFVLVAPRANVAATSAAPPPAMPEPSAAVTAVVPPTPAPTVSVAPAPVAPAPVRAAMKKATKFPAPPPTATPAVSSPPPASSHVVHPRFDSRF